MFYNRISDRHSVHQWYRTNDVNHCLKTANVSVGDSTNVSDGYGIRVVSPADKSTERRKRKYMKLSASFIRKRRMVLQRIDRHYRVELHDKDCRRIWRWSFCQSQDRNLSRLNGRRRGKKKLLFQRFPMRWQLRSFFYSRLERSQPRLSRREKKTHFRHVWIRFAGEFDRTLAFEILNRNVAAIPHSSAVRDEEKSRFCLDSFVRWERWKKGCTWLNR